jgi:hypothetical protein
MHDQVILLHTAYRSWNQKKDRYKLWVEKHGNRTWLAKEGKSNQHVIRAWLANLFIDRSDNKGYVIQAEEVWFGNHIREHSGIVFIDGEANTNNNVGRKSIHH